MLSIRSRHDHAGPLLNRNLLALLKHRSRSENGFNRIAFDVAHCHFFRKISRAAAGTHQRDQIAGLRVVGTKTSLRREIAANIRNIIIIPQFFEDLAIQIQRYLISRYREDLFAQLPAADDHIVRQRIPAEERLAVVGLRRQTIGPFVISAGHLRHALNGLQIVQRCPAGFRETIPVSLVQHHQFRRLGNRENFQTAILADMPFAYIFVTIGSQFRFAHILVNRSNQP